MTHNWHHILCTTGVFLGPVLAVASVASRFCSRRIRRLFNILFIPALLIPCGLLLIGPTAARAQGDDPHIIDAVIPDPWPPSEAEKSLGNQMAGWTVLLLMYWVVIVEVLMLEVHYVLRKAERVDDVKRSLGWILGLGLLSCGLAAGWVAVSDAVAGDLGEVMAATSHAGSWWPDALMHVACGVGFVCCLLVPVVGLRDRIRQEEEEYEDVHGDTTFVEKQQSTESEYWDGYGTLP